MTTPHPHAENMRLYAEDAAETDEPWDRWEVQRDPKYCWVSLGDHPVWRPEYKYRRKPRTITVNGIEVPEPERAPLQPRTTYFTPDPNRLDMHDWREWTDSPADITRLERGLVHLSSEAAQAHAEAMIAPSKREST